MNAGTIAALIALLAALASLAFDGEPEWMPYAIDSLLALAILIAPIPLFRRG